MIFGYCLHHILEKTMSVRGYKSICIIPVHFKLTVSVLMVILIRSPSKGLHMVADLSNHVIAPHQGLLVVTGLGLQIGRVRYRGTFRVKDKVFTFNSTFHPVTF